MAIFVYVTTECRLEAEHHAFQVTLENFRERVEAAQSTRLFHHFPKPYLVKKKFGSYQGRLIAAQHAVGEDSVVVFLSVMIRGSNNYETQFGRDPVAYGEQHFKPLYTQSDLVAYVSERTKVSPVAEKAAPSDDEYGYLTQVFGQADNTTGEDSVCESAEWVTRCADARFVNWFANLFQALEQPMKDDARGGELLPVPGKPGWAILCRRFSHLRLRLLIAPVVTSDAADLAALRRSHSTLLEGDALRSEDVLPRCRRAYPGLVLANGDLWQNLEKDPHANLALSPEESEVLEAARHPQGGFPLFINGRAGSGKSTILQYLFADYLYFHLTNGGTGEPPVYFTCNTELLTRSRQNVETLLRCSAKWWHRDDLDQMVDQNQPVLNRAFVEFHRHLLSLVPSDIREKSFRAEKYVDYSRFKQLWRARFGQEPTAQREYGPDVSWHVIRSYIKGLAVDTLLDPDEYRQLDKKQITVTQQTYGTVYEKVWTGWYQKQCVGENYWDDQDLARWLINNEAVKSVYPAVFCDESQDFTRVELELILSFSLFSDRKLQPVEIRRVPFVFAGDPFQTLNPTGFRWDAIRAFFAEKFIFALDPARRSGLNDLNYRELSFNYRSSRSIVRFSNFVQALRSRLFDLPGLQPQQPWESESNPPPVTRFLRDDEAFWAALKKERDVTIIVPCGEGEEVEYVRQDPVLRQRLRIEDETPDMTVLSAGRAKGLEFARVVVYGFGDCADPLLLAALRENTSFANDPDRSLPLQYFINRLYVAVSRPKRRLFIVDSEEGVKKLWQFAQDESLENAILSGLKRGHEIWGAALARLEMGRASDLSLDRSEDPLENAAALERDGRANMDAYMLRSAAVSFRNAGHPARATLCKAEALAIEGRQGDHSKLVEAANLFLESNSVDSGVDCLWTAGRVGWSKIVSAAEKHSRINQTIEYAFARALTEPPTLPATQAVLQRLALRLADPPARNALTASIAWLTAVRSLIDAVKPAVAEPNLWAELAIKCDELRQAGFRMDAAQSAWINYRAGDLGRALEFWDSIPQRGSVEYKTAKANVAPYPDKIAFLFDLEKYAQIAEEAAAHSGEKLSETDAACVGVACLKTRQYVRAYPHLVVARDANALIQLAAAAHRETLPVLAATALRVAVVLLVLRGRWADLAGWLKSDRLPGLSPADTAAIQRLIATERVAIAVAVVKALARSDDLPRATATSQKPISDFLRDTFVGKDSAWKATLTMPELGAAIERAGRFSDAIRFYENAWKTTLDDAAARHAQIRWVAAKRRMADYERGEGHSINADRTLRETEEFRRNQGITSEEPSAYPSLELVTDLIPDSLPPTPIAADKQSASVSLAPSDAVVTPQIDESPKTSQSIASVVPVRGPALADIPQGVTEPVWTVGEIKFEHFRKFGRINLTHAKTGAIVTIRPERKTCVGDDVLVTVSNEQTLLSEVPEWGLRVDFSRVESGQGVLLELPSHGWKQYLV